jgi:hypothetical protein
MKLLLENWREYLMEQEGEVRVVTFDFDDTLIRYDSEWEYEGDNEHTLGYLRRFLSAGYKVFIVTSRKKRFEENADRIAIAEFVKERGLDVGGILFTEGEEKVHTLQKLGSLLHFDDDEMEWIALQGKAPEIKLVKIDYQTGNIIEGLGHIEEMGI